MWYFIHFSQQEFWNVAVTTVLWSHTKNLVLVSEIEVIIFSVSALTRLVGWQEGYLVWKNLLLSSTDVLIQEIQRSLEQLWKSRPVEWKLKVVVVNRSSLGIPMTCCGHVSGVIVSAHQEHKPGPAAVDVSSSRLVGPPAPSLWSTATTTTSNT